jgi:hypothetical protein
LAIANTIAPSSETSLPISFVVSAATLATWLEIVPIDSVVQIGATMGLVVRLGPQLVALVLEMLLTESTR